MPAAPALVQQDGVAEFAHPRGELAGVARVHAVVPGGGAQQEGRVGAVRAEAVVRGEGAQVREVGLVLGVPVLRHPRGAREELVVAEHVEQGDLGDYRAEVLGVPGEHGAHQEAPVAAAHRAECGGGGDAARDEVFGDGGEVLVGARPFGLQRGAVPAGPVLPSAPDVRDDARAAALQPRPAGHGPVRRGQGDLEAAVAVQERGARTARLVVGARHEVRDARAVPRDREVLPYREPFGVEAGRGALEDLGGRADPALGERGRLEEALHVEVVGVVGVRVRVHDGDVGERWYGGERRARPGALGRRREHLDAGADVAHRRQEQVVAGPRLADESRAGVRREEDAGGAVAREEGVEAEGEEGARRVPEPVAPERHEQVLAVRVRLGVVGHVDLDESVAGSEEVQLAGEEVDRPADEVPFEARCAVVPAPGHDVAPLRLVHDGGLAERSPAPPAPYRARVPGVGQRAAREPGADEDGVLIDPPDAGLGLGDAETVGDELPPHEVEFAHLDRVAAAARQAHERPLPVRLAHDGTAPHPVDALGPGERVGIEQYLPRGRVLAVLLGGGAPPQPAHVLGVPPEVVPAGAPSRRVGDAVARVEHLAHPCFERGEPGVLREGGLRLGVPLSHPGESRLALDVFQPQIRIVISHSPHSPAPATCDSAVTGTMASVTHGRRNVLIR
ncbi:putative prolyl oligopeptidase [Streptomyces sp. Tu6071]|nr:putative prolyl oligopeptidase [Streptomyces sp. Tu6071]